ncbi:hypothetical protein BH23PLA1_BH23PLA1_20500 [soil metagenome]
MYSREDAVRIAAAWVRAIDHPHPAPIPRTSPFTIALSREAGSGGAHVAREIGRRLSWPVYDNELLAELAKTLEVDIRELESVDERPGSRLVEMVEAFSASSSVTELKYFRGLLKLILALGVRGECIIVGRGAMIVLPPETIGLYTTFLRRKRFRANDLRPNRPRNPLIPTPIFTIGTASI